MEYIEYLIGLSILLVLCAPWIVAWRTRRQRRLDREQNQEVWRELTRRVYDLEQAIQKLTPQASRVEPRPEPVAPVRPESSAAIAAPLHETPRPASTPHVAEPPRAEEPSPAARVPAVDPPSFPEVEHTTSLFDRFKSGLSFEEALGRDWLNKVGIALLVIGVAFFVSYEVQNLGPLGKVSVGFVVSAAMLFAGIWFERNERYRILARAGIGGGWALLFFTTYAMYHVPAAHVISSQALDLVLMLIVAAAMVWHTLRYRSQVVTGLAFLLAFSTVTISHDTVYSLAAGIVLAAGLATICCRMQWFELEVFGIAASYLNHYLWLRPIIEPMNGSRRPFPEFVASAGILIAYWLIFRLSYIARRVKDAAQERVSTTAALLNSVLLLLLFKYQSAHPEWAFWALLAIGTWEVALSQLPITKHRRSAVVVLSTVGIILLIAAFPFRFSGTRLAVLWLFESEALVLIGVWTREVVFRRLGMAAALVTAGQMISFDAARIAGMRFDGADTHPDYRLALVFLVAAAVFYLTTYWVGVRWKALFASEVERRGLQWLSYVGAIMLFAGAWIAFPQSWTVVAWCAMALALTVLEKRVAASELRFQAHSFVAASLIRILIVNLADSSSVAHLSLRVWTIGAVALLLYATRLFAPEDARPERRYEAMVSHAYTWAGSALLALLAWYELRPVSVALAWVVLGVLLFEIGLESRSFNLRLQAYLALVAGFCRIFIVNLSAEGSPGEISPRVYTVVPIALSLFYVYWRLRIASAETVAQEQRRKVTDVCAFLGTITVAALMRFEIPTDWVATAWAALAVVLLLIAGRFGERIFLYQSLLLVFAVLFRTVLHNFYQRTYFPAPLVDSRAFCVGTTILLFAAGLPIAFKLRRTEDSSDEAPWRHLLRLVTGHPEQVFFFASVSLLTTLLALDMRHGMVTVSWGIQGVAVFLLALWLGERSFRLTGLGLLLLCVGKIVLVDVWRLNPRDRYLTLIVLGSALLLVSFMYTKHREALRQYL